MPVHLPAGTEGCLVYFVGGDPILEVGLVREGEIEGASAECLDHAGVAYVLARRDGASRHAEGKAPGHKRVALSDWLDGETVADEDGGIEGEVHAVMLDCQPGLQAAGGDGDVVGVLRQAGDGVKGDQDIGVGSGIRVRPIAMCHQGSPFHDLRFLRGALGLRCLQGFCQHPPHHTDHRQHHQSGGGRADPVGDRRTAGEEDAGDGGADDGGQIDGGLKPAKYAAAILISHERGGHRLQGWTGEPVADSKKE